MAALLIYILCQFCLFPPFPDTAASETCSSFLSSRLVYHCIKTGRPLALLDTVSCYLSTGSNQQSTLTYASSGSSGMHSGFGHTKLFNLFPVLEVVLKTP